MAGTALLMLRTLFEKWTYSLLKYLSHSFAFIECDNRLFASWRHFTHYQNPLNSDYIKRSPDWTKSRPGGGVLLFESSVRRRRNVNRMLARTESEKTNESTLEWNLRLTRNQRKHFLTTARFKQAVMLSACTLFCLSNNNYNGWLPKTYIEWLVSGGAISSFNRFFDCVIEGYEKYFKLK